MPDLKKVGGCLLLYLQDPVISDIFPTFGPKSGNTMLTITGANLDTGSKREVTIGNAICNVQRYDHSFFLNATFVFCLAYTDILSVWIISSQLFLVVGFLGRVFFFHVIRKEYTSVYCALALLSFQGDFFCLALAFAERLIKLNDLFSLSLVFLALVLILYFFLLYKQNYLQDR